MAKGRVEIDIAGFNEARRDPAIQAELHRMGAQIAAAAGGAPDFEVIDSPSATRARVVVKTATVEGRRAEAIDRALSRAINAHR
ncbi:hypothetical protein [Leifsonia aquatica]|uniref:hypothetical protein n=1 Tax=Leifsonia aquatica TaxID=144185 RepID=UPI00046A93C9|nr:hypothetical protein [Leifsonia aquatica]